MSVLALTKKYTDFSVLTTPMIYEFVDKILVHAPDRSTGDRTQEVDIYLKFIGKFDVLVPFPLPFTALAVISPLFPLLFHLGQFLRCRLRQRDIKFADKFQIDVYLLCPISSAGWRTQF